ncbi:outer membrane protein assembly factor BamE [Stenotrophomonas maltophilia]|uniref:outer membrane protein assembly factor BamE n=1 Tax=Stenotrophomonas maltophilia TaxID=40324 RepID=UPI000C1584E3|nr:outer membrane protein assembly factor BamE [Stenotrophomonas maltophilia]
MRAFILTLALATPLTLAAGPAHANPFAAHTTGTDITQKQLDELEVGKATQDQVREKFGAPTRREQLGDTQVWYYDYAKIKHFGKNVQESTVFEFGKDNVLKVKSKGAAPAKTGNPFLGG